MAAHAGERQDVGLQARAAARVGRGERQDDGRKFRIGFGGHGRVAGSAGRRSTACLLELRDFYSNGPSPMKKYMCLICGWIYDEAVRRPGRRHPAGTRWEDVPPNWTCPSAGRARKTSSSSSSEAPPSRTHHANPAHDAARRRPSAVDRLLHQGDGHAAPAHDGSAEQKYTLAFVGYGDEARGSVLELTYNYGVGA